MKSYPNSIPFQRLQSLINATHAMSSYSLTLRHGVPFQPVNIRVSSDPISLIEKILAQNSGSYTKLQDLLNIGTNLVCAGLTVAPEQAVSPAELARKTYATERRITGMAIEAALHEDDFETAYSYVVNRLSITPASTPATALPATASTKEVATPTLSRASSNGPTDDGVAWRAALAAGRHKPAASWAASATPAALLRRLEQRAELLAHALLLAPPAALPEILAVWRRCEEERAAAVARASPDDADGDDDAAGGGGMPGGFADRGGEDAAAAQGGRARRRRGGARRAV